MAKHGLVGTAGALNPAPGGCDLGRSSGCLGSVKVPEAGGGDGRSVQGFSSLPSRLLPSAQREAGIVNENSSKCSKRALKRILLFTLNLQRRKAVFQVQSSNVLRKSRWP